MSDIKITFKKKNKLNELYSYNMERDFELENGIYIRKYPADTAQLDISSGFATYVGKNICEEKTEYIVFDNTDTAHIKYPPEEIIDYNWIGRYCSSPQFIEDKIILPTSVRGVLKIKYRACYDLIKVDIPPNNVALLYVYSDNRQGSIVIRGEEVDVETKPTYLTVRDACSKMVVSNAKVFLNDEFVGLTDDNGRIYLGELRKNQRYNIKVIADGYQPTDQDTIANDYFILS